MDISLPTSSFHFRVLIFRPTDREHKFPLNTRTWIEITPDVPDVGKRGERERGGREGERAWLGGEMRNVISKLEMDVYMYIFLYEVKRRSVNLVERISCPVSNRGDNMQREIIFPGFRNIYFE